MHRFRRNDITGLRALAIIPVVAYHARVPGFSGGFVGVDVFFVISGFLITGRLLHDLRTNGRIRFGDFWAKRLRRLVPASALMILLTLPLALLFLPPFEWAGIGKQAAAALVFVSNVFFARQPNGYFETDLALPDPYLHTWSLSVEEQFYLVWPVLIALLVWFASRVRANPRATLGVAFGIVAAVSLAASIVLTPGHSQDAFYLLPTRAWEFALAGLVALLPADAIRSAAARGILAAAGVVGIVAIVVLLPSDVPYPGTAAILPVAAALAVILGGMGPADRPVALATRVLEVRPLTWIGTVSYSWYLWHWPLIVLLPLITGDGGRRITVAASALALGISAVAYFFVENPVRFAPRLVRSPRRSFAVAAAVTAVVALLAGGTAFQGQVAASAQAAPAAGPSGAAAKPLPSPDCTVKTQSASGIDECLFGDLKSDTTVMVIGDSHTRTWMGAFGTAARATHTKLIVRWYSGCPPIEIYTLMSGGGRNLKCEKFRTDTNQLVTEVKPKAVILSMAEGYLGRIVHPDGSAMSIADQKATWTSAYETWVTTTQKSTRQLGVIRDNPRYETNPNTCLDAPGGSAGSCAQPRDVGLSEIIDLQTIAEGIQQKHGVNPVFTTVDRLCDFDTCQVQVDGVPVYRDNNHLSFEYTQTLAPSITAFLTETIQRADLEPAP